MYARKVSGVYWLLLSLDKLISFVLSSSTLFSLLRWHRLEFVKSFWWTFEFPSHGHFNMDNRFLWNCMALVLCGSSLRV